MTRLLDRRLQLLLVALLSGIFAACSFDYGQEGSAKEPETPDAIFSGFVHRVVDKGSLLLEIRAGMAESYSKDHRMELREVSFTQFDASGAIAAQGQADAATVYTDSENAEFRGHVALDSRREKATLEAETLTWTSETKTLEGGLERIVSVKREDGAWVSGAGFRADLRRRTFSFQEASDGRIVTEEAPAANPADSLAKASPRTAAPTPAAGSPAGVPSP